MSVEVQELGLKLKQFKDQPENSEILEYYEMVLICLFYLTFFLQRCINDLDKLIDG